MVDWDDIDFENCAMAEVTRVLRGKWPLPILFLLSQGTLRFGQIKRRLPAVTDANLTKDLRLLESCGFIHREVYREVPPKVEYSLTEIGREFLPVLDALEAFAERYEELRAS